MTTVLLSHFQKSTHGYQLSLESGRWSAARPPESDNGAGISGWGDLRRVGLLRRHDVFVALYPRDGRPILRLDGVEADLGEPGTVTSRSSVGPGVKAFTLIVKGALVFRCYYWWLDLHEWPDDDILDIFLYLPTYMSTPQDWTRFVGIHSLTAQGMPLEQALRSLPATITR